METKDKTRVLVTGAGGFIGGHLVKRLKEEGFWVRAVDIKRPQFRDTYADEFQVLDLTGIVNCRAAVKNMEVVYNLAADMGGIGYLTAARAVVARHNVLINANMLEAAKYSAYKYFYSSSACIYPGYAQKPGCNTPLSEGMDMPADPEPGYGWEKLFTEQLCTYYKEDFGLHTCVARFHNVYGPYGAFQGGKEKYPAALCRKIIVTPDNGTLYIWGDGTQVRTFLYVDDCIEGIRRLVDLLPADIPKALNIGSDRIVTVAEMVDMVSKIANKHFTVEYQTSGPVGVSWRSSDNTLSKKLLQWEPKVSLEEGMEITYNWIKGQV